MAVFTCIRINGNFWSLTRSHDKVTVGPLLKKVLNMFRFTCLKNPHTNSIPKSFNMESKFPAIG